jgi:hypothetical protein
MVRDVPFEALHVNWNSFDLTSFSRTKQLWDYQQEAVQNTIKALWKYYDDFAHYTPNEPPGINAERKNRLWQWYQDNGLREDLDIRLDSWRLKELLADYYEIGPDAVMPFAQFLNRACFWMATGSGKSLVIVKLLEVLRGLIQRGEIPPNDMLVLTHRDDLIEQLKAHVDEFNAAHSDLFIRLRELREYPAAKRESPSHGPSQVHALLRQRELYRGRRPSVKRRSPQTGQSRRPVIAMAPQHQKQSHPVCRKTS